MEILTILIGLYLFIIGISVGSFLNVLIDRLPHEESIWGRSHCDHCSRILSVRELIPIVSFLLGKSRSYCCRKQLSWWYPSIESITGITFVIIGGIPLSSLTSMWGIPSNYELVTRIVLLLLACVTITMVGADIKYQILPDSMQILAGGFAHIFLYLQKTPSILQDYLTVYGYRYVEALVVMVPIFLIYLGTRGKGMGFGDVELAFVMGLLLGWWGGIVALYIAFLTGAVVGVFLLILKKATRKSHIPFGPFLLFGTVIAFLYPNPIHNLLLYFR